MKRANTLQHIFSLPGFRAKQRLHGVFGDPRVRIVELERRKKRPSAVGAARAIGLSMIGSSDRHEINQCLASTSGCSSRGAE